MDRPDIGAQKAQWRAQILTSRRSLPAVQRQRENEALVGFVTDFDFTSDSICAYVPLASEPGSLDFLDALRARGVRVLVPVTGERGPLSWAEYGGPRSLAPGPFGISYPTGPILPPDEIRSARTIFVPALAVDRRGVRLGRGAGYYDRTLTLVAPETTLIAIVRDNELVPALPEDPHDVPMTCALTPGHGLRTLRDSPSSHRDGAASE